MRAAVLVLATACGSTPEIAGSVDAPPIDGVVADATVPLDARTCGQRSGMRGLTTRTVTAGGLTRRFHVYLPERDAGTPMPLVFVHHGFTMSGQAMVDITRYRALADREGIAVAFPDGQGGANSFEPPWSVGSGNCSSTSGAPPVATGDDFAMLDAIQTELANDQCIDGDHIYVTGFSMGGYFSNHAACMYDRIRGAAPHSGGSHDLSGCVGGPVPVLVLHGTGDTLIPPSCGRQAAERWAAHNGCSTTTTSRSIDGGTCITYDGCPAGGQVEYCTFTAMGHCWAGGVFGSIYACPTYAQATELTWEFWKTYAY